MKQLRKFIKDLKWERENFKRYVMMAFLMTFTVLAHAQSAATGTTAITSIASDIAQYIPAIQTLLYAIAGCVALGGAISVYIAMQNDDQDVKKRIMMLVGSCIFLVAAAATLPLFFGL